MGQAVGPRLRARGLVMALGPVEPLQLALGPRKAVPEEWTKPPHAERLGDA